MTNGDWQLDGKITAVPNITSREDKYYFRLGMLGQMKQSCMSQGYIMGKDTRTHQQSNLLLEQKSRLVKDFNKVFSYFERAKSSEGLVKVSDGVSWNAIFCMRDILRELPESNIELEINSDKNILNSFSPI